MLRFTLPSPQNDVFSFLLRLVLTKYSAFSNLQGCERGYHRVSASSVRLSLMHCTRWRGSCGGVKELGSQSGAVADLPCSGSGSIYCRPYYVSNLKGKSSNQWTSQTALGTPLISRSRLPKPAILFLIRSPSVRRSPVPASHMMWFSHTYLILISRA